MWKFGRQTPSNSLCSFRFLVYVFACKLSLHNSFKMQIARDRNIGYCFRLQGALSPVDLGLKVDGIKHLCKQWLSNSDLVQWEPHSLRGRVLASELRSWCYNWWYNERGGAEWREQESRVARSGGRRARPARRARARARRLRRARRLHQRLTDTHRSGVLYLFA